MQPVTTSSRSPSSPGVLSSSSFSSTGSCTDKDAATMEAEQFLDGGEGEKEQD